MKNNDNEPLIPEQRHQGYRNSVNFDPNADEIVDEIYGNQRNPNEPFASGEIATNDQERGNPSLQNSGNCSDSKSSLGLYVILK